MKVLDWVALIPILVGEIDWGLWGFIEGDLVAAMFGGRSATFGRVIHAIVGIAGLYGLTFFGKLGDEG